MAEILSHDATAFQPDPSQRLCGLVAIETSGRCGSVALTSGDRLCRLIQLDPNQRTAVTLTAAIAQLLADARAANQSIDAVAVANGPGSFTGLRIGVTAAKMLAYALGCRAVAVDTLAAMAWALWSQRPASDLTYVAINAYRQQLYVAQWTAAQWQSAADANAWAGRSQLWSAEAWRAQIASARPGVTLAAEPQVAQAAATSSLGGTAPAVRSAPVVAIWPTAADIAQLGRRLAQGGHFTSPLELKPNYLRDSAAEEKLR